MASRGERSAPRTGARRRRQPVWARWPDEKLLDLRFCDLELRIEGSGVQARIQQLYRELDQRGLRFRPQFWFSDDWFTPDGVPGSAIPFYLGHPRLARLEERQMLEIEGGTREWCMRILRHETGHAIDNAYRLRRRRRQHYREKRDRYGLEYPNVYDRELRCLFSGAAGAAGNTTAAQFVQRVRDDVRRTVARWTGEYQYTVKRVLDDIARRCRELRLYLAVPEEQAKLDFTVMVAVQAMNYIHSGQHRVWL